MQKDEQVDDVFRNFSPKLGHDGVKGLEGKLL